MNTLTDESSPGMILVRTPTSAPLVWTSSGDAPSGEETAVGFATRSTGSSVIVAPRASLLWMPYTAPQTSSVLLNGPTVIVNLGLPIPALTLPELLASNRESTL